MTELERQDLLDGEPPAFVFRSPCCGSRELVSAWMVRYVQEHLGGTMWLRCGKTAADPLRSRPRGTPGCWRAFEADFRAVRV